MTTASPLAGALAGRRVLALGAHPDDLALSVGGLLRQLAAVASLTIVSVFTRSGWAPALAPARRTAGAVSALRAREDRRYCRALGAARVALEVPDAGLRGYDVRSELLPCRRSDAARAVPAALARLVTAARADAVLCPLGLGGHVDHVLVAAAARRALGGAPLWLLYEDLPYAAGLDAWALRRRVARVVPRARPCLVEISGALAAKLADVRRYRSQRLRRHLGTLRGHARRLAGGRGYAERVWLASRAATLNWP